MKTNILMNERGGMAALLSVIVLSMIMVSTLSSFYIYIENRAKFQERIRVNYQLGYVMEDMSRAVAIAKERFIIDGCGGNSALVKYIDCTQVCAMDTSGLAVPAGTPQYAVCVKSGNLNRLVNNSDYFCAYNAGSGGAPPSYCSAISQNENSFDGTRVEYAQSSPPKSKVRSWYARMDKFFDTTIVKNAPVVSNQLQYALNAQIKAPTVLGWLLPEKAYATQPGTGGANPTGGCDHDPIFCKADEAKTNLELIGGSTGCQNNTADERCKKCGATERATGACIKFSVCPPWVNADECMASGSRDRRIHQLVMWRSPAAALASAPPPGSLCWGNITPPSGTQNGPGGYMAVNAARCVANGACAPNGGVTNTQCMEVDGSGNDTVMSPGYIARCGNHTAGAGYQGCSAAAMGPAVPPPCGATSTRTCTAAGGWTMDPSCCSGESICSGSSGTATCRPASSPPVMGDCAAECVAYEQGGVCTSNPIAGGCQVHCPGNGVMYMVCR